MEGSTTQQVSLSRKKDYLVIRHSTFSPLGFATESKQGVAQIAEGFNPETALENASKIKWNLEGEPNLQGFYKAVPTDEAIEE